MEPIDDKIYHRQEALALAVQFSRGRDGFYYSDVTRIAEQFLIWLYQENN